MVAGLLRTCKAGARGPAPLPRLPASSASCAPCRTSPCICIHPPSHPPHTPGILDPSFHEYITAFVDSSAAPPAAAAPPPEEGDEPGAGAKVCLARNLPAPGGALEAAAAAAYDGVQMVNGLECKLCNMQQKIKKVRAGGGGGMCPRRLLGGGPRAGCKPHPPLHPTSRTPACLTTTHPPTPPQIAYVLGTEDFFHRRRGQPAARDKAARASKFQAWCAAKVPAAAATPAAPAAAAPPAVATA